MYNKILVIFVNTHKALENDYRRQYIKDENQE